MSFDHKSIPLIIIDTLTNRVATCTQVGAADAFSLLRYPRLKARQLLGEFSGAIFRDEN